MDAKSTERFNCKIDQTPGHGPDGDCWLWTACKSVDGYGKFQLNGSSQCAHRISYQLHTGEIPGGLCVLHSCDIRHCINPAHLSLGTDQDNMDQMWARGRGNPATGERHGSRTKPERVPRGDRHSSRTHPEKVPRGVNNWRAKLTENDVREIRRQYAAGGASHRALARAYGVDHASIGRIIRRVNWAHVA